MSVFFTHTNRASEFNTSFFFVLFVQIKKRKMSSFSCRIHVSNFVVDIVPPVAPAGSDEWNWYCCNAQRSGLRDTRTLTRWQTSANAQCSTPPLSNTQDSKNMEMASLLAKLEWAPCNQASFIVDFRTQSETQSPSNAIPVINYTEAPRNVRKVQPKSNHQLEITVIARRQVDSIVASRANLPSPRVAAKFASFVSIADGNVEGTSSHSPVAALGSASFDTSSFTGSLLDTNKYGEFVCPVTIDPAEVYNSPSGVLEYRFALRDQDSSRGNQTAHLPGTPRYVHFTVTAERELLRPPKILRNFHDTCVLLDELVLDVTPVNRNGRVEYGVGFFSDITDGTDKKNLVHYTRDFRQANDDTDCLDDAGGSISSSIIDFSAPLKGSAGTAPTARNPCDVVIVSSESTAYNNAMIGSRVVATSRFKTDPTTGLCKTSLKAVLVFALLWRNPDEPLHETTMDVSTDRIDLAKEILNREVMPDDGIIRSVTFSYGEVLYFRLRKRVFEGPRHYRAPLLAPPSMVPVPHHQATAVPAVPVLESSSPTPAAENLRATDENQYIQHTRSDSDVPVVAKYSPVQAD